MIRSYTVHQPDSYTPVSYELQRMLDIIQNKWNCKIVNITETKINAFPGGSDQGFIILYDDRRRRSSGWKIFNLCKKSKR